MLRGWATCPLCGSRVSRPPLTHTYTPAREVPPRNRFNLLCFPSLMARVTGSTGSRVVWNVCGIVCTCEVDADLPLYVHCRLYCDYSLCTLLGAVGSGSGVHEDVADTLWRLLGDDDDDDDKAGATATSHGEQQGGTQAPPPQQQQQQPRGRSTGRPVVSTSTSGGGAVKGKAAGGTKAAVSPRTSPHGSPSPRGVGRARLEGYIMGRGGGGGE